MRPLVASIDLAALRSNFSIAQQLAPNSRNFAVIKADAYGHGSIQCALALDRADGYAVATVEEAVELRQAGITKPVLILSTFSQADEVDLIRQYQLMPTIHSRYQFELLSNHHQVEPVINCWLKIDTGMNRLGMNHDEFLQVLEAVECSQYLNVDGVMTHFASADESDNSFTNEQLQRFNTITKDLKYPLSLANSSAILAWPNTHKNWNRPGIMLYGASMVKPNVESQSKLTPVMTLQSQLIAVKTIEPGQYVGYGQTFIARKRTKIGIVACGYADGYPRAAGTGTPVLVDEQPTQILGRVSMDTLCVDLSTLPQANVADSVTLWGENLSVNEVAAQANTISYELLVNVSKRVPRIYQN